MEVAYNGNTIKFTISNDEAFTLSFSTSELYEILGYSNTSHSGEITYTSDYVSNLAGEKYIFIKINGIDVNNYLLSNNQK